MAWPATPPFQRSSQASSSPSSEGRCPPGPRLWPTSSRGRSTTHFFVPPRDTRPPGPIAIVDLDEASLERLGQWPWPRYRIARLLERIREAGATAVGLDMVFAEPDRTSLTPLSGEILRDLGTRIDLAGFPREALDTDRALAATLAGGPFVLGYQFDFETARGNACVLHPLRAAVRHRRRNANRGRPLRRPGGRLQPCPTCRRRQDPPAFSTSRPTRTESCAAFPW